MGWRAPPDRVAFPQCISGGTDHERHPRRRDRAALSGRAGGDGRRLHRAGGDRAADRHAASHPDGTRRGARAHRRRAERAGGRAGRRVLRLQQWRVHVAAGDEPAAPGWRRRPTIPAGGSSASIPKTGAVTVLYDIAARTNCSARTTSCSTQHGGFYFTDLGKARARDRDWGGVYYALADGSKIVEVAHPILTPNGIGLSPDGSDALRGGDRDGAAVGVRRAWPRAWCARSRSRRRMAGGSGRRAGRVSALRQPGGRWRRATSASPPW